jgi:putative ABC transport system permease protein
MRLLELAWRNLLRNSRRSALTVAAVGIGAMAIAIFGGYVGATTKALQTDTVRQVGHLQIQRKGYIDFGRGNPALYAIRDYAGLVAKIKADPELAPMLVVVTPLLQIQGIAGNFSGGTSSNFLGQGWEVADRRTMLEWDGHGLRMPPGASRLREDQPESGVIGHGLAQLLGVCEQLGARNCAKPPHFPTEAREAISSDLAALAQQASVQPASADANTTASLDNSAQVDLLATAADGSAPSVVRMKVIRTERQGAREFDAMYAGMPLQLAQRLLFGPEGQGASALVVQLTHTDQLDAAKQRIEQILVGHDPSLEVQDFHAVNPQYDQVINMFTRLFRFIAALMGVVTLFSVANAVNMSISERVGEIGTLRALGFKQGHIRRVFQIEGALIGLLGAGLGVLGGALIAEYGINQAGWTWVPPGRATPVPIGVDAWGQPLMLAGAVGLLTLLACASAWWPARRASKMEIVEALRHV